MYQLIQTQRSFDQIWLVECKTKRHNKNYFLVSVDLHLGLILVFNITKNSKGGPNSLERSEASLSNSLHPNVPLPWAPNDSPIATSILHWTSLFDPTICAMWTKNRRTKNNGNSGLGFKYYFKSQRPTRHIWGFKAILLPGDDCTAGQRTRAIPSAALQNPCLEQFLKVFCSGIN